MSLHLFLVSIFFCISAFPAHLPLLYRHRFYPHLFSDHISSLSASFLCLHLFSVYIFSASQSFLHLYPISIRVSSLPESFLHVHLFLHLYVLRVSVSSLILPLLRLRVFFVVKGRFFPPFPSPSLPKSLFIVWCKSSSHSHIIFSASVLAFPSTLIPRFFPFPFPSILAICSSSSPSSLSIVVSFHLSHFPSSSLFILVSFHHHLLILCLRLRLMFPPIFSESFSLRPPLDVVFLVLRCFATLDACNLSQVNRSIQYLSLSPFPSLHILSNLFFFICGDHNPPSTPCS
jgi:hypothetical protein